MQQPLQQPFRGLGWCWFNIYINVAEKCCLVFFSKYIHWNSIHTPVPLVLFFVHVTPLQSENKH